MAMTDWGGWKPRETAVLLALRDGKDVLLIHKKRGLGQGKINLPGGRVEPGESWDEAARRETQEETGLVPQRIELAAEIRFQFIDGYSLEVRAFVAEGWSGALTPCDEADPFWHPAAALPWNRMWADDALWLPPVLENQVVRGSFVFSQDAMLEAEIEVRDRPSVPRNG